MEDRKPQDSEALPPTLSVSDSRLSAQTRITEAANDTTPQDMQVTTTVEQPVDDSPSHERDAPSSNQAPKKHQRPKAKDWTTDEIRKAAEAWDWSATDEQQTPEALNTVESLLFDLDSGVWSNNKERAWFLFQTVFLGLESEFERYCYSALDYMTVTSLVSVVYDGSEPPELPDWMRLLEHISTERCMEADLPANFDWLGGGSAYEADKE
jgi:hypothetical protein